LEFALLLSMTGFGESARQDDHLSATVEVRAINNRYFKINTRYSDGVAGQESKIEGIVRRHIKRGTVQVNVRVERLSGGDQYRLNGLVLDGYRRQLEEFYDRWHMSDAVSLESLLALPGVVDDATSGAGSNETWSLVEKALQDAMRNLAAMRAAEGEAMAADLSANVDAIAEQLLQIEARSPAVAEGYSQRLTERINKLLAEYDVQIEPADVVREVGLFAERSDISEEVVRLRSHIDQFREAMASDDSAGRRLEFVTQEMYRETNTIGSKANDGEISRHVIEIKTAIERIREMVQNVE
jgi:uncharacterized protein (TIGR00255 family)